MRAIIFSRDHMSTDVLRRSLIARNFTRVDLKKDTASGLPDDDEAVVFLDFDVPEFVEFAARLSHELVVVPFGRHEVRGYASDEMAKYFLAKPFTREQVLKATHAAVLNVTDLTPTVSRPGREVPADLERTLANVVGRVKTRRRELGKLLNATPEQLRMILAKATVTGPDGKARVPDDALPIRSALVVDKDQAFAKLVSRYLSNKCVLQVTTATDGEAAWKQMNVNSYDVIIMEWEIPLVRGLALYNRLRGAERTRFVPLIVTSPQLKADDFRLLDEDFAVTLLVTPVAEKSFSQALETVVGNSLVAHAEQADLLAVARRIVEAKVPEATLAKWLGTSPDPMFLNAMRLTGEAFLAEKRYRLAETTFSTVWGLGDRRLSLLTGYGKACHLAGSHRRARRLLAKADILAPKNVERLCLLGEVDLNLKNPEMARERFLSVLAIDSKSRKAKSGVEVAEAILEGREKDVPAPVGHFAGHLNLVGIKLSQELKTQEALRFYNAAMVFVRKDEDLVKLWFNIGLCYLRSQQKDKAEEAFRRAYTLSGQTFERAAKYIGAGEVAAPYVEEDIPFERF